MFEDIIIHLKLGNFNHFPKKHLEIRFVSTDVLIVLRSFLHKADSGALPRPPFPNSALAFLSRFALAFTFAT